MNEITQADLRRHTVITIDTLKNGQPVAISTTRNEARRVFSQPVTAGGLRNKRELATSKSSIPQTSIGAVK